MSAPHPHSRRPPPAELSESQPNSPSSKPGIRLVPYSPPRLDHHISSSPQSSPESSTVDLRPASSHGTASPLSRSHPTAAPSHHGVVSEYEPPRAATPESAPIRHPLLPRTGSLASTATAFARHDRAGLEGLDEFEEEEEEEEEEQESDDFHQASPAAAAASTSLPRLPQLTQSPQVRRQKSVALHSDKTFSLVPLSRSRGCRATPSFSAASASTHDRPSEIFSTDDRPSSPATTFADPEPNTSPCSASSSRWTAVPGLPAVSPSSSRMVGGLRRVSNTAELRQPYPSSPPFAVDSSPRSPASSDTARNQGLHLLTKLSLQSIRSDITLPDTPNYRVYGSGSPESPTGPGPVSSPGPSADPDPDPDSDPNQAPSEEQSGRYAVATSSSSIPSTDDIDEKNYIVYGAPSSSSSVAISGDGRHLPPLRAQFSQESLSVAPPLRAQFSQESLTVAPLKTVKRKSIERPDRPSFYKTRSRESLRRSTSLASISSYLTQEALQGFLAVPTPIHFYRTAGNVGPSRELIRRFDSGTIHSTGGAKASMIPYPPQWSPQLSTVASESEAGPDSIGSPPASLASGYGRYSGGFISNHSRQLPSISSSLAGHSRSPSESSGFNYRETGHGRHQINYQDEDGDGLADLRDLHHRPSRRRLSSFFSSSNPSDQNLQSPTGSRVSSFSSSSVPSWARLYYGGRERRLLMPSSESLYSIFRDGQSRSPPAPETPSPTPAYQSQRPAAAEAPPQSSSRGDSRSAAGPAAGPAESVGEVVAPPSRWQPRIRKQTSSIWSPHLRPDRRASRYTIWDPPQVDWRTETSWVGRRNIQLVCFVAGFVFPFAWMIASCAPLPPIALPPDPVEDPDPDSANVSRDLERHRVDTREEAQYQSARWWRQLNRYMSVVGILVLAAVISLIVVGIKQRWGMS